MEFVYDIRKRHLFLAETTSKGAARTAAIFTNTQDVMTSFVANGATTIFSLNSLVGNFSQRNENTTEDVIRPRTLFDDSTS